MFSLTACGNLLLQPLRLFEISLRETNGSLAGHWSSVTADKGRRHTLGYRLPPAPHPSLKPAAKVLPAALQPSSNLMIMRSIVQDLGAELFFISFSQVESCGRSAVGPPPFQNTTSRLDVTHPPRSGSDKHEFCHK